MMKALSRSRWRALTLPARAGIIGVALGLGLCVAPAVALAGPNDWKRGLAFVKQGDCVKAVPILEEAENDKHRASVAYALAGCYVKTGDLLQASAIYHALSEEKVTRAYTHDDKAAVWASKRKADEVDARIPSISFEPTENYEELEVEIDGTPVKDPSEKTRVAPDTKITITARAKGRQESEKQVVLQEKEHRVVELHLDVATGAPASSSSSKKKGGKSGPRDLWLGVRARGMLVPKFMMNAFGEGGTNLFLPGGDVTLTTSTSDADFVFTLGYTSYRMAQTPFKLNGRPDTEYEMLESNMQALTATASIIWNIQMDKLGRFHFRVGGGIGVGWMFAGDLGRTQAYPLLGSPDDPASYVKCQGPNSPAGTFRYCNQLDKDANHYNGYTEPSWFSGGARPLIFPWLAVPELGFSWRMTPGTTLDLDLAVTISGAMAALGMRFAL